MIRSHLLARGALLTLLAVLVLIGCAESKKAEPAASNETLSYELFPSTHILDDAQVPDLVSLSAEGSFVFVKGSPYAALLAPKHVILVTAEKVAPAGLLRRVLSVDANADGTTTVTTEDCPIQRAFRRLHLKMNRPVDLASSAIKWDVAPGTTLRGAALPDGLQAKHDGKSFGPFTIDYYPFNGDHDTATPEDQVHVVATVYGGLDYFFGIDYDWPDWDDALTGDVLPEVEVGYSINAGAGASLKAEGVALLAFERQDKLAHADLGRFCILPLCFWVSVDLISNVEGQSKSRFTMESGVSASFVSEASFSSKSGGHFTPPTPDFTLDPVTVTATENSHMRVSVSPRLHLKLYGIVGPYAGLNVYGDLTASNITSEPNSCWKMKLGVGGEVGIELALFGETLADWNAPFDITDKTLAQGACLPDPATTNAPDLMDPAFTPFSERLVDTVVSWETQHDVASLHQAVDGTWLLAGSGARALSKVDKNGTLIWSRTYTRQDAAVPVPLYATRAINTRDVGLLLITHAPAEIIKLNSFGERLWNLRPELPHDSVIGFLTAIEDEAGNIYLGGGLVTGDDGNEDAWILKIDAQGNVLWSKRYGQATVTEWVTGLALLNGDLVVSGRRFGQFGADPATQSFLFRLSPDGAPVWMNEIKGCGSTEGLTLRSLRISQNGDIIAGGSYGLGALRTLLAKFKAADGALGWANGASNNTLGLDLTGFVQLTDGGYLMVGTLWTYGANDHVWVARSDSVGRPVWMKRLSDTAGSGAPALGLTGEGGALVGAFTSVGQNRGSLWLTRLPVKTGDFTLPASVGQVNDEMYTEEENPCITITPTADTLVDFAVTLSPDPLIEKDAAVSIEKLL